MPFVAKRTPYWPKWRGMSNVSIWEAVALSLYIDPDKVRRGLYEEGARHGFSHPIFEEGQTFNQRIAVVCSNRWRIEGQPEPGPIPVSPDVGISLDKFVDFAVSEAKWPIPDELLSIREAMRVQENRAATVEPDDAVSEAKPRAGGRKPEYAWDEMDGEILRFADLNGLPDIQADLIRHLLEWFERHYAKQPAESAVKERVSRWYRLRASAMAMEVSKPKNRSG